MRPLILATVPLCLALAATAPAGPTAGESATLKIVSLKVRATKAGGGAWDAGGGLPDLKVVVEKKARPKGDTFTTRVVPDATEAKFDVRTIKVKDGDEIEVTVVDEDAAADDLIGKMKVKVTAKMLRAGMAEWSFGEVLTMKVEFVD
jgi:hypothetical protein